MAKEPARLVDMKERVDDLKKELFFHFKELVTRGMEVIDLTSEELPQRLTPKEYHRKYGIDSSTICN
ncbi:hypothetical protein ACFX13_000220 [Malus domestica]